MRDLTRGVTIPTDLDCDFSLTRWNEDEGDVEWLLDEGTPIGVHEVYVDGQWYRVTCSVEAVAGPDVA